jgi:hypothetical protein
MPNPGDDPTFDAQTQAPVLYVLSGVFLTASCIAVSLRIYNRAAIRNSLGIDDLLIVFSAVRHPGVRRLATCMLMDLDLYYRSNHRDYFG